MSISDKLDRQYEHFKSKILLLKPTVHRRRQALLKNWLHKLDEPTTIETWQRLRNTYAKELLKQLLTDKFDFPFNKNAPEVLQNFRSRTRYNSSFRKNTLSQKVVSRPNLLTTRRLAHTAPEQDTSYLGSLRKQVNPSLKKNDLVPDRTTESNIRPSSIKKPFIDRQRSESVKSHKANSSCQENSTGVTPGQDVKRNILSDESSISDTQTAKRWRTKARQLEQVVAAQRIRIDHLEEVIRSLRLQKNREIERIETFHKVKIDDLSRVQTDNLKKMKNVQDLHPAEKELLSVPGNTALEFDAVLAAAQNIKLSAEEEKVETIPFYTTLSQVNSYPQESVYLQNQKHAKARDSILFSETTYKSSESEAPRDKNHDQYFEYLSKFQNTMTKIVSENKNSNINLSVTVSNLDINTTHDEKDDNSVTIDSDLDEGRSLYINEL